MLNIISIVLGPRQISFLPDLLFVFFKGNCNLPLGLEDKSIPDSDITASSELDQDHAPSRGRLNTVGSGSLQGAWSPKQKVLGEWIQVGVNRTIFPRLTVRLHLYGLA